MVFVLLAIYIILMTSTIDSEFIQISEEELAEFWDDIADIFEETAADINIIERERESSTEVASSSTSIISISPLTPSTTRSRDKRSPVVGAGKAFLNGLSKLIRGTAKPAGQALSKGGQRAASGAFASGASQARMSARAVRAEIRKVRIIIIILLKE
jgi:hypothetical protein